MSDEPIYLIKKDGSIKEAPEETTMLEAYHYACQKKEMEIKNIRVGEKPITKK